MREKPDPIRLTEPVFQRDNEREVLVILRSIEAVDRVDDHERLRPDSGEVLARLREQLLGSHVVELEIEWGLLPSWVDDPEDSPRPINARSETAHEKPMFRSAFKERRCLVLSDGFLEWKRRRGSKQPYRIERADGNSFAFAGLWETWGHNGDFLETCTILMTDANEVVGEVHDRMPVMLEPDDIDIWLGDGGPDAWQSVLDPYPDDFLTTFPVSRRVNDPSNDSSAVLEPIDIGEQSGLGDFSASD